MSASATQAPGKRVIPAGRRILGHLLRGVVAAAGIAIWFGTQFLISRRPVPASGIGDALFSWTGAANLFLHVHPTAANALLITSSAIIDGLSIFLLATWIFGGSIRPFLGLTIVLGLRQLMQALIAFPTPTGMIWRYPGFPSLLVTYSVGNDYFFSAHTAIVVLGAIELFRTGRPWVKALAILFVIFEICALIVLRAHYTADLFTGFIAALLSVDWSARLAPFVDQRLEKMLR